MNTYKEFKVGDLITTYFEGYFELVSIEKRDGNLYPKNESPLFYFKHRFNKYGESIGIDQIQTCDARHCSLAKDFIPKEIFKYQEKISKLQKLLLLLKKSK